MNLFDLSLTEDGYSGGHDDSCQDGLTYNEFATAAFRFGHTLIPDTFVSTRKRRDTNFNNETVPANSEGFIPLKDNFNNPDILMHPLMLDDIMNGVTTMPMAKYDSSVTNVVRNHLRESRSIPFTGKN